MNHPRLAANSDGLMQLLYSLPKARFFSDKIVDTLWARPDSAQLNSPDPSSSAQAPTVSHRSVTCSMERVDCSRRLAATHGRLSASPRLKTWPDSTNPSSPRPRATSRTPSSGAPLDGKILRLSTQMWCKPGKIGRRARAALRRGSLVVPALQRFGGNPASHAAPMAAAGEISRRAGIDAMRRAQRSHPAGSLARGFCGRY